MVLPRSVDIERTHDRDTGPVFLAEEAARVLCGQLRICVGVAGLRRGALVDRQSDRHPVYVGARERDGHAAASTLVEHAHRPVRIDMMERDRVVPGTRDEGEAGEMIDAVDT